MLEQQKTAAAQQATTVSQASPFAESMGQAQSTITTAFSGSGHSHSHSTPRSKPRLQVSVKCCMHGALPTVIEHRNGDVVGGSTQSCDGPDTRDDQ